MSDHKRFTNTKARLSSVPAYCKILLWQCDKMGTRSAVLGPRLTYWCLFTFCSSSSICCLRCSCSSLLATLGPSSSLAMMLLMIASTCTHHQVNGTLGQFIHSPTTPTSANLVHLTRTKLTAGSDLEQNKQDIYTPFKLLSKLAII